MKFLRIKTIAVATWILTTAVAMPAGADVVTDWNDIARQAIALASPPRQGPSFLLDFAAVHAAIHDAIQAYQGRFESYGVPIADAAGSPVAAAAKAARDVLIGLLPGVAADTFVDAQYLAYPGNGVATNDPGILVGQQAAAQILAMRDGDGAHPATYPPFVGGTKPGEWRPTTPTSTTPMVAPWLGKVRPFTLKSSDQMLENAPPPHLTSGAYVKDYEEVKALGAKTGSARTPEQTDIAHFFSDNAVLYWNRALIAITNTYLTDIGDSARMFALVNMAMTDAVISSWASKTYWNFWRPLTAIKEGDNDLNPRTVGDPNWESLITTPNYPDYTSGANNLSGSATTTLASFFGTDNVTFSLTSNAALAVQKTRTYTSFSAAADDVVEARIYEGIHFRFADVRARRQGRQVANWAFAHFLRPIE